MVETISPVVHGGRARWLRTLALHTIGSTVTAASFGATLAWIGRALGAPWQRPGLLALAAISAVYAIGVLTPFRVPVPQLRRQVPDWWRTYFGRSFAALLYGAGLGIGFLTYLSYGTLVVVAFAAVASGRPAMGALIMAPFGLARGLSAVVSWRSTDQERSRALVDRLAAAGDAPRRIVNGVALVAIALAAAVAAVRVGAGSWGSFAAAALAAVFVWAAASKVGGCPPMAACADRLRPAPRRSSARPRGRSRWRSRSCRSSSSPACPARPPSGRASSSCCSPALWSGRVGGWGFGFRADASGVAVIST